jgi:hypothetical protein
MSTTDRSSTQRVEPGETADRQPSAGQGGAADTGPEDGGDILTLVCFKCGTEYYFSEGSQPAEMTCDKCGNTVFRSFLSRADERESEEYEEATHRDLRTDDPEGDPLPGDLLDLDRV